MHSYVRPSWRDRRLAGFRRQEDALTSTRWLLPRSLAVLSSPQLLTVFPERRVRVVFASVALLTSVARRRHWREGDMQDLLLSQGLGQLVSAGWRTLLSCRESVPLEATADERTHTSTEPGFCNGRSSRARPFEGESTVARWRGRR